MTDVQGAPQPQRVLQFLVVTKDDAPEPANAAGAAALPAGHFYTRDGLRSLLVLAGCKPRYAYKVVSLVFQRVAAQLPELQRSARRRTDATLRRWALHTHDASRGEFAVSLPRSDFMNSLLLPCLAEHKYRFLGEDLKVAARCAGAGAHRHHAHDLRAEARSLTSNLSSLRSCATRPAACRSGGAASLCCSAGRAAAESRRWRRSWCAKRCPGHRAVVLRVQRARSGHRAQGAAPVGPRFRVRGLRAARAVCAGQPTQHHHGALHRLGARASAAQCAVRHLSACGPQPSLARAQSHDAWRIYTCSQSQGCSSESQQSTLPPLAPWHTAVLCSHAARPATPTWANRRRCGTFCAASTRRRRRRCSLRPPTRRVAWRVGEGAGGCTSTRTCLACIPHKRMQT